MRRYGIAAVLLVMLTGGAYALLRPAPVAALGHGVATLAITVTGVAGDKGNLLAAVCDSASFLKACAYRKTAKAVAGTARLEFEGLSPGRYAVMVFHDENANLRLDAAPNGLPLEGYGFSRNAQGKYGPPEFDAAAVDLRPGSTGIDIRLVY